MFANAPLLQPGSMYPVEFVDVRPSNHRMRLGEAVQELCKGSVQRVVPFCRCERLPGDLSAPLLSSGVVIIHFYFEGGGDSLKASSLMMVVDAVLITQNLQVA